MRIQVEMDYGSIFDLLGKPGMIHSGQIFRGPEGIELQCENVMEKRAMDANVVVDFILTVAAGVPSSMAATWLWKQFGSRARRISIERKEIERSESGFIKVVSEKIEIEE